MPPSPMSCSMKYRPICVGVDWSRTAARMLARYSAATGGCDDSASLDKLLASIIGRPTIPASRDNILLAEKNAGYILADPGLLARATNCWNVVHGRRHD